MITVVYVLGRRPKSDQSDCLDITWEKDFRGKVQKRKIFGFCRPRSRSRSYSTSDSSRSHSRGRRSGRKSSSSSSRDNSSWKHKNKYSSSSRSRGRSRRTRSSESSRSRSRGRDDVCSSSSYTSRDSSKRKEAFPRQTYIHAKVTNTQDNEGDMKSADGVRNNLTNIKLSPSGSCVSKSSCKENVSRNFSKEYIDEDGFKPRIVMNDKLPDRNKRSEKRVLKLNENLGSKRKNIDNPILSKDVQFLLKVKRLRKSKEKQDKVLLKGV